MKDITILPGFLDQHLKARFAGNYALGCGDYHTKGAWDFGRDGQWFMLPPGSSVRGCGTSETHLRLSIEARKVVNGQPATYLHLLSSGALDQPCEGHDFSDMTLHCLPTVPVKALWAVGTSLSMARVHVEGLWGSRMVTEGEGFGILLNNCPANASDGGALIVDCRVTAVPGAYCTAIYPGITQRPGHDILPSYVRECVAVCPSTPDNRAHCAYGLNSFTTFAHCESHGFERAFFSDTGSGDRCAMSHCTATGCTIAVELRSSLPEWHRRGLEVADSTFVFGGSKSGYVAALVLADDSPATAKERPVFDQIEFKRCSFHNVSGHPGHVGSSTGPNFAPATFTECKFYGHWLSDQAEKAGWKLVRCTFLP